MHTSLLVILFLTTLPKDCHHRAVTPGQTETPQKLQLSLSANWHAQHTDQ